MIDFNFNIEPEVPELRERRCARRAVSKCALCGSTIAFTVDTAALDEEGSEFFNLRRGDLVCFACVDACGDGSLFDVWGRA